MTLTPGSARYTALVDALDRPELVERYRSHIVVVEGSECLWWTGAISGRGHGRFRVDEDLVVIAHRFGFAIANGIDALAAAEVLAHYCDNPLCQNPAHLTATTIGENRRQWARRRKVLRGSLRDRRGSRGRSLAIRDAIRSGLPLEDVLTAGMHEVDALQLPLWGEEEPFRSQ